MRPKTVLLLAFALGCGLVASIGISQYLQNQGGTSQATKVDGSMMVVVATEIPRGVPIDEKMLRLEKWPKDKLPDGAISDPQKVIGRVSQQRLFPGEPILEPKLAEEGNTRNIPTGMRTVTIRVNLWTGGAGFVRPEDKVDVIMLHRGGTELLTRAKSILENIEVWAVDQRIEAETKGKQTASPAQAVTLLVTPEQAVMVTLAAGQGDLQLVRRSGGDTQTGQMPEVNLSALLRGAAGAGVSDKANTPTPSTPNFTDTVGQFLTPTTAPANPTGPSKRTQTAPSWSMKIMQGRHTQEEKNFELAVGQNGKPGWKATSSTERASLDEDEDEPTTEPAKPEGSSDGEPKEIETKSL